MGSAYMNKELISKGIGAFKSFVPQCSHQYHCHRGSLLVRELRKNVMLEVVR